MARGTTREIVLEAAPILFAERGYGPTSVRQVAEVAGTTPRVLFHHFGTKEGLLNALAQPLVDELDEALATPAFPDADLDRATLVRTYVALLLRRRDVARVLLVDDSARTAPAGVALAERQRRLAARLVGPRGNLERQVRARCALAVAQLAVGDLKTVPAFRLRLPLTEAAVDALVGAPGRTIDLTDIGGVSVRLQDELDTAREVVATHDR
ncbi:MAG: TetR/AcrR family transcriptional regulator [Acidimicrobiia bacterium]